MQLRHYRDRHVTFWRGAAEGAQGAAAVTLLVDGAPGGPMHHELLSTTACALALLQHPSRFTCPHTSLQRRCAFFAHRQDLQLPLVFRAQVRYEATDPILLVDNAISLLQIRPGGVCFTVLDVPAWWRLYEGCSGRGAAGALCARACL